MPQLDCNLLNVPIEFEGTDRKPTCMIAPDAAMVEAMNLVEQHGRITAATKRPEMIPTMPDSVTSAVSTAAPLQVHPAFVEHDLAGVPLKEGRLSEKRRQQT